ncbi:MAG TPA: DUF1993 domain-containing protein [Polyangiaceae bacterium]|nr:DUF1993 domain-containing protein [Polyangiaceae bacterium]
MQYFQAIRQFIHTLKAIDAALTKAERYAEARKFDVNNFCSARLAPDMLPFVVQVRIACDHAKNAAANLSGKPAPKHEDNEANFADLHGRIEKCLSFLETLGASDFEKTNSKTVIKVPYPPGKALLADDYLWGRQVPNFYFHVSMIYALLRHGGVDLGKGDFLGPINIFDA